MTEFSYPFAGQGATSNPEWSELMRDALPTGIVAPGNIGTALRVFADSTGLQVKVPAGLANVRGHRYRNSAQKTLPIESNPDGQPRIDTIILRLQYGGTNNIRLAVKKGLPAETPAPRTLEQTDDGVYEEPLADVLVRPSAATILADDITDRRRFFRTGLAHGRGTTAERDTAMGIPTSAAARLNLANAGATWYNTDFGWLESYFVPANTAGLTVPGLIVSGTVPAGWYPIAGGPEILATPPAPANQQLYRRYGGFVRRYGRGGAFEPEIITTVGRTAAGFRIRLAGRYDVTYKQVEPPGNGFVTPGVFKGDTNPEGSGPNGYKLGEDRRELHPSYGTNHLCLATGAVLGLLDVVSVRELSGTGFGTYNAASNDVNNTQNSMTIRYAGPPIIQ